MHPDLFAQTLESKLFTNGSDRDVVLNTYWETYNIAKHARAKRHMYMKVSLDEVEQYCQVVADYEDLEVFAMVVSTVGDGGAVMLMRALTAKPRLLQLLGGKQLAASAFFIHD